MDRLTATFSKYMALTQNLHSALDATKDQLLMAMEGHVVQYGETYVTYGR